MISAAQLPASVLTPPAILQSECIDKLPDTMRSPRQLLCCEGYGTPCGSSGITGWLLVSATATLPARASAGFRHRDRRENAHRPVSKSTNHLYHLIVTPRSYGSHRDVCRPDSRATSIGLPMLPSSATSSAAALRLYGSMATRMELCCSSRAL